MENRRFRVTYLLHSLQTKNQPLFPTIRVYLVSNSTKDLFIESKEFTCNHIQLESTLHQETIMNYSVVKERYSECKVSIQVQFESSGHFIKMGEATIDLGEVINRGKSGEQLKYGLEKCYDRSAILTLSITFKHMGHLCQERHDELQSSDLYTFEGRYSEIIRPRKHLDSEHANQIVRQNLELESLSQRQNNNELYLDLASTRRGKRIEEGSKIREQLIGVRTELKVMQHRHSQLEKECAQLRMKQKEATLCLRSVEQMNHSLEEKCRQLRVHIQKSKENACAETEILKCQNSRILKELQESEKQRLLLKDHIHNPKEFESTPKPSLNNKIASLQKIEQSLRQRIQEYMKEIAEYDRALRIEQKHKEKTHQQTRKLTKLCKHLESELKKNSAEFGEIKQRNEVIEQELSMSRVSTEELQKQVQTVRLTNKELQQQVERLEAQLSFSNQVALREKQAFVKRLQEFQMHTHRQEKDMEFYMSELENKKHLEESLSADVKKLMRQVVLLQKRIDQEVEKSEHLNSQLTVITEERNQLQKSYHLESQKKLAILQENMRVTDELSKIKDEIDNNSVSVEEHISTIQKMRKERDYSEKLCKKERDSYWKEQVDKLEKDIQKMIEKSHQDKEELQRRLNQSQSQKHQSFEQLRRKRQQINELNEQKSSLTSKMDQKESRIDELLQQVQQNNSKMQILISSKKGLERQIRQYQEVSQDLSNTEKTLNRKGRQIAGLRSSLEQAKDLVKKYKKETKLVIELASEYLSKTEKQRVVYQQISCQLIDIELSMMFNSSAQGFCERHNSVKKTLQSIVERDNNAQYPHFKNESVVIKGQESAIRIGSSPKTVDHTQVMKPITTSFFTQNESVNMQFQRLKQEVQQLKIKLRRTLNQLDESQREVVKFQRLLTFEKQELSRALQQLQDKQQLVGQLRAKIRGNEKLMDKTQEQVREHKAEISQLRFQLDHTTEVIKRQRSTSRMKNQSTTPRNVQKGVSLDQQDPRNSSRVADIELKYQRAHQQLERIFREKQEKRQRNFTKQLSVLETRLKQKTQAIHELQRQVDTERESYAQNKDTWVSRMRKLKDDHDSDLERLTKELSQTKKMLEESQQCRKRLEKALKTSGQKVRQFQLKLIAANEREGKINKFKEDEWQLKIKLLRGQKESEAAVLKQQIQELKAVENSMKQKQKIKIKENEELQAIIEKKDWEMQSMKQEFSINSQRIKALEEEEKKYQQAMQFIQGKTLIPNESQIKLAQNESGLNGAQLSFSNSLKAFSFQ